MSLTIAQRLRRLSGVDSAGSKFAALAKLSAKSPQAKELRDELWETYAPEEWQGEQCPHRLAAVSIRELPRGQFPDGLSSAQLRWVLSNVSILKEAELLIQESVVRQNALHAAFPKLSGEAARVPKQPNCYVWGGDRWTDFPYCNQTMNYVYRAFYVSNEALLNEISFLEKVNRVWMRNSAYYNTSAGVADALETIHTPLEAFLCHPPNREVLFYRAFATWAGVEAESEGNVAQLDPGDLADFEREERLLAASCQSKQVFKCPLTPLVELMGRTKVVCATVSASDGNSQLFFPPLGVE